MLVAFLGLSAANVLPVPAQGILYVAALAAMLKRPQVVPGREGAVALFAVTYIVLLRLAVGIELDGALRVMRPLLEGLLLAAVLFKWCGIRSFRSAAIVLSGFVALQFFIGLAMGANPSARTALIESIYADEAYENAQFAAALLFRGYGFSRHHLYGLALAVGVAVALMLEWAVIEPRRRLWFATAAVAGMLLVGANARVGFVPIVIAYIGGLILLRDAFYAKHMLTVAALLAIPIAYLGAVYFGDDFDVMWTWLAAGFEQFGGDRPDASTLSDLQRMFVLSPDIVELVFGMGRACGSGDACDSDIGFVRALQEGGSILLALIMWLYWQLNRHAVRLFTLTVNLRGARRRRAALLVALVMQVTFIAAMIKGEAFGPNDYSRLVATLGFLGMFAASGATARRHFTKSSCVSGAAVAPPLPSS